MNSEQSLVKNSFFLSGKAILSVAIAFFSSRLLFKALGENDYGLYDLVAGFILLLSSLRTLSSTSIQRFINVAKGENDLKQMNIVLSLGILIHLVIAIIFLLLAETIGLWCVNHFMVIEPSRLSVANYVYQFSVIVGVMSILITPFEGLIIAHERLKFYSINTSLEMIVKLCIIISLNYISYDNLITYAFLLMISTLLFRVNILVYCFKKLNFYNYKIAWNKQLFKELINFSGWSFLGSITYLVCHQGINLVLNVFGGTALNAARGFAYQIMNALNQFISNLSLVVSPRVMTNYRNKKEQSIMLLFFVTKSVFYIVLAFVLPLLLNLNDFLKLWLDKVPEYTEIFTVLIIGYLLVKIFVNAMNTLILSHGNLKTSYLMQSILSLFVVFVSYIFLNNGLPFYTVFVALLVAEFLKMVLLSFILNHQLGISFEHIIHKQFKGPLILSLIVFLIYFFMKSGELLDTNLFIVILHSLIFFTVLLIISYVLGYNKVERKIIKEKIVYKFLK